jgi:hypothetical protein
MGGGQQDIAMAMLRSAAGNGDWLVLKNVHLVVAWLPVLEKELNALRPHERFRLWLTTESHSKFPPILLQQSLKVGAHLCVAARAFRGIVVLILFMLICIGYFRGAARRKKKSAAELRRVVARVRAARACSARADAFFARLVSCCGARAANIHPARLEQVL